MDLLHSERAYAAHHSDNPQGMVRVVENVANSLEGRLAEAYEDVARAEKRLADILTELAKPFEKEESAGRSCCVQREINAALDLDKDNAGAMEAEAEAAWTGNFIQPARVSLPYGAVGSRHCWRFVFYKSRDIAPDLGPGLSTEHGSPVLCGKMKLNALHCMVG